MGSFSGSESASRSIAAPAGRARNLAMDRCSFRLQKGQEPTETHGNRAETSGNATKSSAEWHVAQAPLLLVSLPLAGPWHAAEGHREPSIALLVAPGHAVAKVVPRKAVEHVPSIHVVYDI